MIRNAMNIITELNLTDFVQNFKDDGGFVWSNDDRVGIIKNALSLDSHIEESLERTLRNCQYYFIHPADWEHLHRFYEQDVVEDDEPESPSTNDSTVIAGSPDTELFFEPID